MVEAVAPAPVWLSIESIDVALDVEADAYVIDVGYSLGASVALTGPLQPLPPTAVVTAEGYVVGHADIPRVVAAVAIRYPPHDLRHGTSTVSVRRELASSNELDVMVLLSARDAQPAAPALVVYRSPSRRLRIPSGSDSGPLL